MFSKDITTGKHLFKVKFKASQQTVFSNALYQIKIL